MTDTKKIADALIEKTRDALLNADKPLELPQEAPHVMTVAQYNERFGIKGE